MTRSKIGYDLLIMYPGFLTNQRINKKIYHFHNNFSCSFFKTYRQLLFFLSFGISLILISNTAFARCYTRDCDEAGIYEGVRKVTGVEYGRYQECVMEDLDYWKDYYNDTSNPFCNAYDLGIGGGLTVIGAGIGSIVPGVGTAVGSAAGGVLGYGTNQVVYGIVYATAKMVYKNTRICGNDWYVWSQFDNDDTKINDAEGNQTWSRGAYLNKNNVRNSYGKCLESLFDGSNQCNFSDSTKKLSNKYYREYIYSGKEYEDSSYGSCDLPKDWDDAKKDLLLGYHGSKQRYYMRGPGVAPNYACDRFINWSSTANGAQDAYNCCKKRSQSSICIEYRPDVVGIKGESSFAFCQFGKTCTIKGVTFEAYKEPDKNLICAKTGSLCPYNHPIAGGTEVVDYDVNSGAMKNYCQYLNHCIKIPESPYISMHKDWQGRFISESCKNLKGDSQNNYVHDFGLLPIKTHNFSAPIVQCFKETINDLLIHRGKDYVVCDGAVDENGACISNHYLHKEGEVIAYDSFLVKVQSKFQGAVRMCLVLAIMFFGCSLLLGLGEVKQKHLIPLIIKIALVAYFATSNGWQTVFMDGLTKTSDLLVNIVTAVDPVNKDPDRQDGCQFPKFNYRDLNDTNKDHFAYPPGKEYLKIWDTLDCKISRAIGYGPSVSVPNMLMMTLAGFLTSGAGIIFLVAVLTFGFFLIFLVIRAIHIFLISSIGITMLIYVSPIMITMSLFSKTKQMFDNWFRQLIGLILQPMILFAYLGMVILIFDSVIIGDVTFSGDARVAPRQIDCNQKDNSFKKQLDNLIMVTQMLDHSKNGQTWTVKSALASAFGVNNFDLLKKGLTAIRNDLLSDNQPEIREAIKRGGGIENIVDNVSNGLSDSIKESSIDPFKLYSSQSQSANNTSVYCIFNIAKIKTLNSFSHIGIGLPLLATDNIKEKTISLFKAALLMYILTKFLDGVQYLAMIIANSPETGRMWGSFENIATKSYGVLRGSQKRGMRASLKLTGRVARGAKHRLVRHSHRGQNVKRRTAADFNDMII